jgi:excisionase family DNA binding protein
VPPIPSAQCDPFPGNRPHRVAEDSNRPHAKGEPGSARGPPDPLHASIVDVCRRHGCSRTLLYKLMSEKKIRAVKLGRRLLVDVASADSFFASLPQAEINVPSLRATA